MPHSGFAGLVGAPRLQRLSARSPKTGLRLPARPRPGFGRVLSSPGAATAAGAAQIPLSLAQRGASPARRALGAASGATGLTSGLIRAFPAAASRFLPATELAYASTPGVPGVTPVARGGLPTALQYAGPALQFGGGLLDFFEDRPVSGAFNTAGAIGTAIMISNPATAPFSWIPAVLGSGGGFLSGLGIGGRHRSPAEKAAAERAEAARDIGRAGGFITDVEGAGTPQELYDVLTRWNSGSVGGTSGTAVVTQLGDAFIGQQNPIYDVAPLGLLFDRPDLITTRVQSGVQPGFKSGFDQAAEQAVRTAIARLRPQLPGGLSRVLLGTKLPPPIPATEGLTPDQIRQIYGMAGGDLDRMAFFAHSPQFDPSMAQPPA